jgi:hypothetical protein
VSGGIGVGTGGIGMVGSVWYTNNKLVVGAHKTVASEFWGRDVHDTALLLGLRDLAKRGLVLIAAGPARVGGLRHRGGDNLVNPVPSTEQGVAIAAEGVFTYRTRGFGTDLFAAWSKNRTLTGATFSIQVGLLGN